LRRLQWLHSARLWYTSSLRGISYILIADLSATTRLRSDRRRVWRLIVNGSDRATLTLNSSNLTIHRSVNVSLYTTRSSREVPGCSFVWRIAIVYMCYKPPERSDAKSLETVMMEWNKTKHVPDIDAMSLLKSLTYVIPSDTLREWGMKLTIQLQDFSRKWMQLSKNGTMLS
jgi:hypothetical protein